MNLPKTITALLYFTVICMAGQVQAQVQWGDEVPREDGSYVMSVMDGFNAGFYALIKQKQRKLGLQMYDFNLKQRFDQTLTLPEEALKKKMFYEKIVPSDNDYISYYKILRFNISAGTMKEIDIDLHGKFIKSMKMCTDKNDQIYIGGIYGKGVLIYQSVYSYSVMTESASGKTTKNSYEYGDMILIYFNMSNSTIAEYRIPKRQHTEDDGGYYSGYKLLEGDKDFYIVYNDNVKNLELQKGKSAVKMTKAKSVSTIVATINKDNGELSKKELFSNSKLPVEPAPSKFLMDNAGNIIVFGDTRMLYKFGKIVP